VRYILSHIAAIEIEIQASREVVFQVLTDFEAATSGSGTDSHVVSRDNDMLLVEFRTPVPVLFKLRRTFLTLERVTLHGSERIEFEEVKGPFAIRRERIVLEEGGEGTKMIYEAEFGLKGWALGWLLGVIAVRPKLKGAMRRHMKEMKETIEARARRGQI
jgi:carbon monoxide dehydrogenase subunit G